MSCAFWLWWILFNSVWAIPWSGPPETIRATATADWTPAPTKGVREVFKRDLYPVSLCGWQGPGHQEVYCSGGSSCAWFTDVSVVGCCSIGGSCDAVYTSCVDHLSPQRGGSDDGVYSCKSNDLCYRNMYPGGYYQYGCGSTSIGQTVVTSWTGINTQFSIAIVYSGGLFGEQAPLTDKDRSISTVVIGVLGSSGKTSTRTTTTSSTPQFSSVDAPVPKSSSSTPVDPAVNVPTQPASVPPSKASPAPSSPSNDPSTTSDAGPVFTSAPVSSSPSKSKSLSTGTLIAISIVPAIVTITAIGLLTFCLCVRHKKRKTMTGIASGPAAAYDQPIMGTTQSPVHPYQAYQHYPPLHEKEAQAQYTPELESPRREAALGLAPSYEASMLQSKPASPAPSMPYQSHFGDIYEMPENRALGTGGAGAPFTAAGRSEPGDLQIRNR